MKGYFAADKTHAIKKIVALVIIFIGAVFVLANLDVYYSNKSVSVKLSDEVLLNPIVIEVTGDRTFEQEFVGWDGTLDRVIGRFDNQGNQDATGMVTINILDGNRNVIQTASKPLDKVKETKKTKFDFDAPEQLSGNQTYILQMVIDDAYNAQGFGVFSYENKGKIFGQLYDGGQAIENRLGVAFRYSYYNSGRILHMMQLLLMALIFVLLPLHKIDEFVEKKWNKKVDVNKWISRLLFLASPVLCFMLADKLNGFTLARIINRMDTWIFAFNLLIYVTIWLVIYVLVNRVQYASMILLIVTFAATIANYYVWEFRGCPILATDVQSLTTAMNVAANFNYSLDSTGVWGVVYITAFTAVLMSLKGYKGLNIKKRIVAIVLCVAVVCGFNGIFFHSDIVKDKGIIAEVWHPQIRYAKNGTALSFVLSWTYTKVEKPGGYKAEKLAELVEQYPSDSVSEVTENEQVKPNVITIMCESLGDLSYNGDIEFSEDYLPFIHGLTENTVKGKLYVSIQGANTANSEFEFLTGNSMMFLPFRCIPYNLYIKDKTPSIAQNMQAQGYSGINSYHPYLRSGWNRENVYPLLGFNNFYADEYYYQTGNDSLVRNYISDEADFNQIIADYEAAKAQSDAPFYLFNVTMQNHGGYDGKRGAVDVDITIENEELAHDEAEQYINLAKMSDEAFEKLVVYFEKVEEPTMIVMFGDHQPPINNAFYKAQFGCSVNNLTTEQQANWYSAPYVIWANYDIEEAEVDMSANYLSSYVMNLAGLKLTGYNKYLLELQKTLPVISAVCYMDAEGNIYANDEKSEYSDLLKEYQMVQYNQLFDMENRYNDFFFLKE